jgi:predicted nucleotide-binding protein
MSNILTYPEDLSEPIKGEVEIPSDLRGILYYPYTNDIKECFSDVEKELKDAFGI